MKKSNQLLKKSVCFSLVLLLSLPLSFSEKSYTITESELNQIQEETVRLTQTVEKLENQKNEYLTLSSELKRENEELQAKVRTYRLVTIGVCSGTLVGSLTYYILNK